MTKAVEVSESSVTADILAYLRSLPDSWWFKKHSGGMGIAGIPDIIGLYKGQFIAVEVKAPHRRTEKDGGLSIPQQRRIQQIITAQGIAIVAYSVDDVKVIFEHA